MSQSSLPPGRDFAVVPTLDSERESPYSYVAQWTTSGLSFSGHHITVDLPTGNLLVSTTDASYPYYKAPFGVRRTLDIQEQQMHETGLRDYVNSDPRPHWFGNWSFGFESDVAETWKVTRTELMINTGVGLGGLFAVEDPDFRLSSPTPMDTLLIYGVSRRMMEHLGWSPEGGSFMLRTRSGRFQIATGRLQENSLVDTLEGEVAIFDPVSGSACRLSTLMGYDHRSGEDRFVDRSMLVARSRLLRRPGRFTSRQRTICPIAGIAALSASGGSNGAGRSIRSPIPSRSRTSCWRRHWASGIT